MNPRPIIDARMLTRLERAHFTGTVTIQEGSDTQGPDGSPTPTWSDLDDHVDLPCQVVPDTAQSSREVRRADQSFVKSTHTIHLTSRYASITEKMRAVSGGRTYNILLVVQDSQSTHTSLICEIVE